MKHRIRRKPRRGLRYSRSMVRQYVTANGRTLNRCGPNVMSLLYALTFVPLSKALAMTRPTYWHFALTP